jgi:hypothetical protein
MRRLLIIAAALCPSIVAAQGVPLLSVDLTRGAGRHTLQTPHLYYFDGSASFLRTAITVRLGTAGAVRPVISIEANSDCAFLEVCGDKLSCALAPDNSCFQNFHQPIGAAAGAGLAGALGPYLLGAVTVGAARGERHVRYVDGSATLRLAHHLGIVAGLRHMVWTDAHGDRTWFTPISVGLRTY